MEGLRGRSRELSTLTDAFRAACVGQAGAVLVGGDAGVGKTKLVSELVRQARRADAVVLTGSAIDIADAPPFWPVLSALRTAVRSRPDDDIGALLDEVAGTAALGPRRRPAGAAARPPAPDDHRARRAAPGAAGGRGPALGRPVHPRPGRLPRRHPHLRAGAGGGHVPQRHARRLPGPRRGARRAAAPPEGHGAGAGAAAARRAHRARGGMGAGPVGPGGAGLAALGGQRVHRRGDGARGARRRRPRPAAHPARGRAEPHRGALGRRAAGGAGHRGRRGPAAAPAARRRARAARGHALGGAAGSGGARRRRGRRERRGLPAAARR